MARPLHGKAVFWGGSVQRAARQISIQRVFSPKHVEPQQNSLIQTDCAPTGLEHHMTQRLQPVTKLKTRHDRPPMRLFSAVARSERDMLCCVGSWLPRQTVLAVGLARATAALASTAALATVS
jgi:hypothetical protein